MASADSAAVPVLVDCLDAFQMDSEFCYQTYYSQSCSGANCSIGAWFYNPCQGTSYYGANTFAMPTTVSFSDTWDNQCATLEARSQ